MRNLILKLLFRLLGERGGNLTELNNLFGQDSGFEARTNRWKRALASAYQNKDLLDYLKYQTQTDLERVFRGKSNQDMVRGARMRTLFIVFQMRIAYLKESQRVKQTASEKKELEKVVQTLKVAYSKLTSN